MSGNKPTKTKPSTWSERVKEYEDQWQQASEIEDVDLREQTQETILTVIAEDDLMVIMRLLERSIRLRNSTLTSEELQNLCHNLDDSDFETFTEGCREYQKKLFGKCDTVPVLLEPGVSYVNREIKVTT